MTIKFIRPNSADIEIYRKTSGPLNNTYNFDISLKPTELVQIFRLAATGRILPFNFGGGATQRVTYGNGMFGASGSLSADVTGGTGGSADIAFNAFGAGFSAKFEFDQNGKIRGTPKLSAGGQLILGKQREVLGVAWGHAAKVKVGLFFDEHGLSAGAETNLSLGLYAGSLDSSESVKVQILNKNESEKLIEDTYESVKELIRQEDKNVFCFVAGTMVDMADGMRKPIEQVKIGDEVRAFDPYLDGGRGGLRASKVTQTHATPNRIVIDFHGTRVTPGHLFLCGDGPHEGKYSMLMDIIRADGAVVRADGTRVRAATNCEVGSEGDRMMIVGWFHDSEDAYQRQGKVRISEARAGLRVLTDDGKDWSLLDALAEGGFTLHDNGLVAQPGEEPHPFYYFGEPPKPEDYILKKSGLTLDALYAEDKTLSDGVPVPPARPNRRAPAMPSGPAIRAQEAKGGNRKERRRQQAVQRKKYGETLH